jgi:hypothetical protein
MIPLHTAKNTVLQVQREADARGLHINDYDAGLALDLAKGSVETAVGILGTGLFVVAARGFDSIRNMPPKYKRNKGSFPRKGEKRSKHANAMKAAT